MADLSDMAGAEQEAAGWTVPSAGLLNAAQRVLVSCLVGYGLAGGAAAGLAAAPGAWAAEWRGSGLAGVTLGGCLVAVAALAAATMMNGARRSVSGRPVRLYGGGRAAQAVLVPGLAMLAAFAVRAWPGEPVDGAVATALGGLVAVAAFPALVVERFVEAISPAVLPEAAALRRVLGLPVATLLVAGGAEALRGQGLAWPGVVMAGTGFVLLAVAVELCLRGLLRWFQPPADPTRSRAATYSLLAELPGLGRRGGLATPLRAQFGLDFSRSWALAYLRAAAVPAAVMTGLFCWLLSGTAVLPQDARGLYERFGQPVAVFGPGLHIGLPWPLGRVRVVDFGVVHATALGGERAAGPPAAAEGAPPAEADRLWDQPHPGEADWLIAGNGLSAGSGVTKGGAGQSFALMSADIRVLWRVGLSDADALRALYGVAEPDVLVRAAASQVAFRFFAGRTLDSVLDQRQQGMADEMAAQLSSELASTGLEVVAVAIEAVHPPAGAAAAYHDVQAAEIIARTSVSAEAGRAKGIASLAREQSWSLLSKAHAVAGEALAAAGADSLRFEGDRAAAAVGGRSLPLDRYLAAVATAFARAPLTVVDARLAPGMAPVIDLRPLAAATRGAGAPEDTD